MAHTDNMKPTALDWVLAKILEKQDYRITVIRNHPIRGLMIEREPEGRDGEAWVWFCPTRRWADIGPFISDQRILFQADVGNILAYFAITGTSGLTATGVTHQMAASRLVVKQAYPFRIAVPEELT